MAKTTKANKQKKERIKKEKIFVLKTVKESSEFGDVNKLIGMKLRQKRTLLGLSQEALGDILGVTFQQIQKYESGLTKISISRLLEICTILKTPISFFLDGINYLQDVKHDALNDEKASFEYGIKIDKKSVDILKTFYRIENQNVARNILNLIKSLAKQ